MSVVVDSSVWIDFFADRDTEQVRRLSTLKRARDIVVGDMVLLEVLRGARSDIHSAELERWLRAFRIEAFLGPELALKAASNYRRLRSLGFTVRKTPDLIIGTFCITRGHYLLHNDRDFDPMVEHLGLRLA